MGTWHRADKMPSPSWYKVSALACASEFLGLIWFSFFGGIVQGAAAAVCNGISLAVIIYCVVAQSGGHLNPGTLPYTLRFGTFTDIDMCPAVVTWSMMLSGHMAVIQGLAYIVCQFVGGIVGAALTRGLKPDTLQSTGCFGPVGISHAKLFGMEFMATTLLIVTVYGVAVSQKGSGNVGPTIIGLSLLATALAIGPYTGAALNPARVLGPSVVYGCKWKTFWVYLLAHLAAATVAAVWGLVTNPHGPFFVTEYKSVSHVLSHTSFTRAVPWSTAADPLNKVDALTSKDASLAPYARGIQVRKKALEELEGLIEKPDTIPTRAVHYTSH